MSKPTLDELKERWNVNVKPVSINPGARRSKRKPKEPRESKCVPIKPMSFDPREWKFNDLDVIEELRDDYDYYADATARKDSKKASAKDFTFPRFPDPIRDSLDALQKRTFQNSRPGAYALTYCALRHGLQALSEHPIVKQMKEAQNVLDGAEFADMHERRVVKEAARAAYADQSSPGGSTRRWNIRLPEGTVRKLGEVAESLGVSSAAVAVLAIQITLSTQQADLEDQREEYARAVEGFLRRVELRAEIVDALVERLAGRSAW